MTKLVESLKAYQEAAETVEVLRDQFENTLREIVWKYHRVFPDFERIVLNGDGSLFVDYSYTCRGCSDRDQLTIPAHVISATDPLQAAEDHNKELVAQKTREWHAEQVRELERLEARCVSMRKELGQ